MDTDAWWPNSATGTVSASQNFIPTNLLGEKEDSSPKEKLRRYALMQLNTSKTGRGANFFLLSYAKKIARKGRVHWTSDCTLFVKSIEDSSLVISPT